MPSGPNNGIPGHSIQPEENGRQPVSPGGSDLEKTNPAPKAGRSAVHKKPGGKPPRRKKNQKKDKNVLIERVARRAGRNPVGHAIGQYLYLLGFYAECKLAWVLRGLRAVAGFVAQLCRWLFGGLWRSITGSLKALWLDLTEPFRRRGRRHTQARREEELLPARSRAKARPGMGSYLLFLRNLVSLLLPVGAAAVFLLTVYNVLGREYNLAVTVDGTHIGYIPNETYFEQARSMLRDRIVAADGRGADEWLILPEYRLSIATGLTSQPQLVNNILLMQNAENESALIEAVGVYVDQELLFATTDIETVDRFLAEYKEQYRNPERDDAEPEYVQDIDYDIEDVDALFYASSVWEAEDIVDLFASVVAEEQVVVADGEASISEIAHDNDLTLYYLMAYNPDFVEELDVELSEIEGDIVPEAGTVLVVQPEQAYLQVMLTYEEERVELLPYDTIRQNSDLIVRDREVVQTRGTYGEQIVTYYIEELDGIRTERRADDIETVIIQEAEPEIILVGTRDGSSVPLPGSGALIFPVPEYSYSRRGYSAGHRAMDINAPAWTPIIASDNGTVTMAGWHWSYGWHVVIDHGNGLETLYAHMVAEPNVAAGEGVSQGSEIGYVGTTGTSTGNHCHFEVRLEGVQVDPYTYVGLP